MQFEIEPILAIAVKAGQAILTIYNDNAATPVSYKADASPLTVADEISHNIIIAELTQLYPGVPILSEEGSDIPYEVRKGWELFWCVDPLDGTKEFINRNGEFTVNIALIKQNKPVLGVIYVPCQNLLYYADNNGSYKMTPGEKPLAIAADQRQEKWISIGSRSHADTAEQDYLKKFPIVQQLTAGSSLKFCLIAEGKAHIYYRKGPTMEWDTAAGQAIAEKSGALFETDESMPFLYNKQNLRNGSFICRVPYRI